MMGAVHLLPGTTFSSVSEKGSYASEERASLTLAELERWLALQIAGVYHFSIHSALGKTPLAAWQEDAETTASHEKRIAVSSISSWRSLVIHRKTL
jgi:hypothetical protein